MSTAWRRQQCTLDLVEALADALEMILDKLPLKVKDPYNRIRYWKNEINTALHQYKKTYNVTERQYNRYAEKCLRAKQIISANWPDQVDCLEFLTAVVLLVSDVADQVPDQRKHHWQELVRAIQEVYEFYDRELTAPEQERGQQIGLLLKEALW